MQPCPKYIRSCHLYLSEILMYTYVQNCRKTCLILCSIYLPSKNPPSPKQFRKLILAPHLLACGNLSVQIPADFLQCRYLAISILDPVKTPEPLATPCSHTPVWHCDIQVNGPLPCLILKRNVVRKTSRPHAVLP